MQNVDHVLGKYIISDRPMTIEQWAAERATVVNEVIDDTASESVTPALPSSIEQTQERPVNKGFFTFGTSLLVMCRNPNGYFPGRQLETHPCSKPISSAAQLASHCHLSGSVLFSTWECSLPG